MRLKLLVVVALCAFTGIAAGLPGIPDNPLPFFPPNPQDDPEVSERVPDTDPIMHLISDFMLSTAPVYGQLQDAYKEKLAQKLAEYGDRIEGGEDYEAYICRAFTRLTSLSHEDVAKRAVGRFGFNILDREGSIEFTRRPLESFDTLMRENEEIDEVCEIAVPVLTAALADLEKVPKNWADGLEVSAERGYNVDEAVYFDYADCLLARAAISEMISFLYLEKGYNTLAEDGKLKDDIDLAALKEAQRWMHSAAVLVNAFTEAASVRDDPFKNNFFMPRAADITLLRENAQNLVNVPYWTVRFDLDYLSSYLYLNGPDRTEEKDWKRERLYAKTLDVSLRSLFEGKVRTADGTFPRFNEGERTGLPILDSLTDATLAGTFPGMSRTELGYLLRSTSGQISYTPDNTIANYGVLYMLPEGAVNNPENPLMFDADLRSAIMLLYPTMAGYDFTGWTRDIVNRDGVIPTGTAETLVFTGRFAQNTPEGEGTPDNPWEIGTPNAANVKAWTDGAGKLIIAGKGEMKDFTLVEAPWYSMRDSITALEIESGVTSIGELAFNNCRVLARVTIPSSVKTIGKGAFYGCPLTRMTVNRGDPPWLRDNGLPSQFEGKILVPSSSVDRYKTTDRWSDYADRIGPIVEGGSGLMIRFL